MIPVRGQGDRNAYGKESQEMLPRKPMVHGGPIQEFEERGIGKGVFA